jgi:hypothetical protein
MAMVSIDASGALRGLRAEPPEIDSTRQDPPAAFDWSPLFTEAGLDPSRFQPAKPMWVPPCAYDARAEWTDQGTTIRGFPLRVAAAAFAGRPVYFEVLGPWSRPERQERATTLLTQRIAAIGFGLIGLVSLIGGVILTRHNLKLGRGDRRGAFRLGQFVLAIALLSWLIGGHHVLSVNEELTLFARAFSIGLLTTAIAAVLYLAIEPYVRRTLPDLMIGWARLLEGRFRDPRVGRDVLVGAVVGAAMALGFQLANALPTWIPILGQTTVPPELRMVEGGRHLVSAMLDRVTISLFQGLPLFCLGFVLRIVFRRSRATLIALIVIATLSGLGGENWVLETPFAVANGIMTGIVVARFGLLTTISMWLFRSLLSSLPLPLDFSAPYATSTLIVLVVVVALAFTAFRFSLGSRPLFTAPSIDA